MRPFSLFAALLLWGTVAAAGDSPGAPGDPQPSLELGARTYIERCVLCHGNRGMGEGIMPLLIRGYPDTNLLQPRHSASPVGLREVIIWGGNGSEGRDRSPPWGAELTWTQIESLVLFVDLLRFQPQQAARLREQVEQTNSEPAGLRLGRLVFRARCALCHGNEGRGDGRMARMIKDPPPFNLTLSGAPPEYLRAIITKGGAGMGRSAKMPPWGDELSMPELNSVILYLLSLREQS